MSADAKQGRAPRPRRAVSITRPSARSESQPVLRVDPDELGPPSQDFGDAPEAASQAKRSGKYARPICVGIVTKDDVCRPFISHLLLSHGHRTTKRTPSADSNELIDVVLVLDRSLPIAECTEMHCGLKTPVLVVSEHPIQLCTALEFPCRFSDLERQIFVALGRLPPTRPEADDKIGVNPGRLMSILSPLNARLVQVFLDHNGLPVPDAVLLDEGFEANVTDDARDKGVRRLRQLLRYIRLDLERIGTSGWRLVW